MSEQWRIRWHDSGREPQVAPNPDYPEGKDVVMLLDHRQPHCTTPLPYPARRCGYYEVQCRTCGLRAAVTTAGRPDDPRSVTVPCKERRNLILALKDEAFITTASTSIGYCDAIKSGRVTGAPNSTHLVPQEMWQCRDTV